MIIFEMVYFNDGGDTLCLEHDNIGLHDLFFVTLKSRDVSHSILSKMIFNEDLQLVFVFEVRNNKFYCVFNNLGVTSSDNPFI